MDYIKFKKELKELMKSEFGRTVEISFEMVEKNNGKSEESIVLHKQKEDSQIVIGLPGLYEEYKAVQDIWYSFGQVLNILMRGERISEDKAFFEWERVKGLISMRLINLAWNRNRLKELAYKEFFDLAVTFYIRICQSEEGTTGMTVSREMMKIWGKDTDDLWEVAMNNLKREEFQILTLREAISALQRWNLDGGEESQEIMYILTNSNMLYGAVGIFRTDILNELAGKLGTDLYIIPSSIHEIILVPQGGGVEAQELKKILKSINAEIVLKEERLSNELYYFSRERKVVQMI